MPPTNKELIEEIEEEINNKAELMGNNMALRTSDIKNLVRKALSLKNKQIEELKKKKEINFGSWKITIRDNMVVCGNCGTQLNIFKFSSCIELPYLYCDDDCLKEHLKQKHKGDD